MAVPKILRIPFQPPARGRSKIIYKPVAGQTGTRTIRHSPAGKIRR